MSDERPPGPSRSETVGLAAIIALHLGLVAYFAPPRLVFSRNPVAEFDYALHLYQVDRALEAFRGWAKLWSYDPLLLAGQPAGVIEDLTSKATELWVIALSALRVHPGFAFNLFIVLVHLALPAVAYASARAFGLSRAVSAVATLLWVLLWFFDSFLHWCWWIGMITWLAASQLAVLSVALLYRALESRRRRDYLLLAPLAALLVLLHPFAALTVLIPALALYVRAARSLALAEHVLLWLAAVLAASTVLIWVGPALAFRHYIGDVGVFMRPTLEYVLYDTLDLLKDQLDTGDPVRTMVRTLCFVAGAIVLYRWHTARDRRVLPLLLLTLWPTAVAYLAGYVGITRQTQPYRQIAPAMLAAALPAAALLAELLKPSAFKALTRSGKMLFVLCLVLIVPRFVRTVLYYMPHALPKRAIHAPTDVLASSLVGPGERYPLPQRHDAVPTQYRDIRDWLLENHDGRGRIVVTEWVLGEYLAASTKLPLLGGIKERNVPHVDANLFRSDVADKLASPRLADYFERYAVGFVIVSGDFGVLDHRRDLLRPAVAFGGHRIYRTKHEPSYFLRGSGRVAAQQLNRVLIEDATGDEIVVRFHWMETLRCRPDCTVERYGIPHDRVGFMRVSKPPRQFEIYNSYELR